MQLVTTGTGMSHSEIQYFNSKSDFKQSSNAAKQWPVYPPIHLFCSDLHMDSMVHEVWTENYEHTIFLLEMKWKNL